MNKIEKLQNEIDKLARRKSELATELTQLRQSAAVKREAMGAAILAGENSDRLQTDLVTVEVKAAGIENAIEQADTRLKAMGEQLAGMVLERDQAEYLGLEKQGQAALRTLAAALVDFKRAQDDFTDLSAQMTAIARQHPEFSFKSEPPTKAALIPRIGPLFAKDIEEMINQLNRFVPGLIEIESPKGKSILASVNFGTSPDVIIRGNDPLLTVRR